MYSLYLFIIVKYRINYSNSLNYEKINVNIINQYLHSLKKKKEEIILKHKAYLQLFIRGSRYRRDLETRETKETFHDARHGIAYPSMELRGTFTVKILNHG